MCLVRAQQTDAQVAELPVGRAGVDHDPVPATGVHSRVIRLARSDPPKRHAQCGASVRDRAQAAAGGAGDREVAALDDGCLLAADGGQVRAEVRFVVALHVSDGGDAGVEHVRGVEPAAHADFDQRHLHVAPRELDDGGGGERLELGWRPDLSGNAVDGRQDARHRGGEVVGGDRLSVECHPLAITDEVRFGHAAHTVAAGDENRAGHGDHRALAIRATHQRAAQLVLRMADLGHEPLDALEAHADPEATTRGERRDRLAVGEPAGIGQAISPRRPRKRRSRGTDRSGTDP